MSETSALTIARADATLTVTTAGELCYARAGIRWTHDQGLAVIHYYDRQHPRPNRLVAPERQDTAFGTAGTPSLSGTCDVLPGEVGEGRLTLHLRCAAAQLYLTLELALLADGSGFTVTVPPEQVREGQPELYRLLGIEVLPEFGAATTGEAGYLVLPNWYGARCHFHHDYPREVWQTLYSSNDQWEYVCNLPAYGIVRQQGTLCAVITAGDADAQFVARQHWERARHHSLHPYLVWRWAQEDELLDGPRAVEYTFAPPDAPCGEGYVVVGLAARRWWRQRGLLTWAEKARTRPEAADYAGRFFLKMFLAYKDPQEDGHGPYHVGCTFAEACEIIAQCLERGMRRLCVILVGWGQDGHDGQCPTYHPPDERLGGAAGMRDLIAWCRDHDVMLGVHTSHNAAYSSSPEYDPDTRVQHRSGEPWTSIIWSGGRAHRVCPTVSVRYAAHDLAQLAALGMHGHHHYDAVGGFMLCYAPAHPVTRRQDYFALIRREFEIAIETMGSVSTEMPFGPYFDLTDGVFHAYVRLSAWHRACPIGRWFYDETIPLLPVVLHGSCLLGQAVADTPEWATAVADLAVTPQYEVSWRTCKPFGIPAYADRADLLARAYARFFGPYGLLPQIGQAVILERRDWAPGVSETLYDNGWRLWVNRTDKAVGPLEPRAWRLQPAAEAPLLVGPRPPLPTAPAARP